MSNLFRQQIVTYTLNGSYRTPDGTRVTKDTPGATPTATVSSKWYGTVNGKKVPLSASKETALKMLRKAQSGEDYKSMLSEPERRKIEAGPVMDAKLTDHLADYRRYLEAKNDSAGYVEKAVARCETILKACGFTTWHGISEDAIAAYLLERRKEDGRTKQHGFGVVTSNHYITAMKGFTRWMVTKWRKKDIILTDPLYGMKKMDAAADVRLERRALDPKEFQALLTATRNGPTVRGLTGPEREALYVIAAYTGLRASELATLTPNSFTLGAEPVVTVAGAHTKNGKPAVQPLQAEVAQLAARFIQGKAPVRALWPGKEDAPSESWHQHAAEMLRVDLAAAEIPFADHAGRVFDFHALRHQFITNLARAGVELSVAQKLARHSTPILTANVYTHLRLHDQAAAVAKLPSLNGALAGALPGLEELPGTSGNRRTQKQGKAPRRQVLRMAQVGT